MVETQLPVILGIGFISGLFAYLAIQTRPGGGEEGGFGAKLSLFFFIVSILFANLLFYALTLMVQNDAAVAFLETPIIEVGLLIMTYSTIGVLIIFVIWVLGHGVMSIYDWVMQAMGQRGRNE
jgi:hypothetical protein